MAVSNWTIDPSHTDIVFSAKHMMVTTVRGTFHDVAGTITIDEDDPTSAQAEFSVGAASLSTGFEARDQHLRSADFFDAENHPTIGVKVVSIERVKDDDYRVTADLTIREVTKPAVFDVEVLGFYQGFKGRRVGFRATTKLQREEWGLNWNMALETGGWLVSKEIRLEVDIAADEVTDAASEAAESAA